MTAEVWVIGPDPFNRARLAAVAAEAGVRIHPLLSYEAVRGETYPLEQLLEKAAAQMAGAAFPPAGITGFWDFPVSDMVPILAQRFDLRGPPLEAVVKCEDKFWSRLEQRKVVPDCVPRFARFDPFAADPLAQVDLPFPFWIKPVKAWRSQLGFRIGNQADFREALAVIREQIGSLAEPFNALLRHLDLPAGISGREGAYCLAEELITGRQCTLEGYVLDGEVVIYGIVDSIRYPNATTFSRYQYPSRLPVAVRRRMQERARTLVAFLGLDNTAFNIEFFYDSSRDRVWLLEINPRISQSHSELFAKVDGYSNLRILLDVALGRHPQRRAGAGAFRCAAKYFLRRFADAEVEAVPGEADRRRLADEIPGALAEIEVTPGMHLAELPHQDPYSYELGYVFLGAANQRQLLQRIRRAEALLPFRLKERDAGEEDATMAGSNGEEAGGGLSIKEVRELAARLSAEEIESCIHHQLDEGHNPCAPDEQAEEAMNVLAKAEYVRHLMDRGQTLSEAIRELGRRIRAVQQGGPGA